MSARGEQLNRIEAALERVEAALAGLGDAVSLDKAGGLAAVMSVARQAAGDATRAATAAEAAFVGVQTLAAVATAKPEDGPAPSPPPLPAEAEAPAAGMGSRIPKGQNRGGKM